MVEVRYRKSHSDRHALHFGEQDQRRIKNRDKGSGLKFPLLVGDRNKIPVAEKCGVDELADILQFGTAAPRVDRANTDPERDELPMSCLLQSIGVECGDVVVSPCLHAET